MQENYAFIADAIDTRCQLLTDIADDIWDHPETRFEEFWARGTDCRRAGSGRFHPDP